MPSRLHYQGVLLLIGILLLIAACSTKTALTSTTTSTPSPTATLTATVLPQSSPTPMIQPTPTLTEVADGCNPNFGFGPPPGALPPNMPLPPDTLVARPQGINAGSYQEELCTPSMTSAAISTFLQSALPAAGWQQKSPPACNMPSYPWYQGIHGVALIFDESAPNWVLVICPHIGQ